MRFAAVHGAWESKDVEVYLPGNYEVYGHRFPDGPSNKPVFLIRGEDDAGWTLDGYVIPRLASGLLIAVEAINDGEGEHRELPLSILGS